LERGLGLPWSTEGLAEKGGGNLLELVMTINAELHRRAIPCDEFADETAPYFGEPSFFDFAESLPPCLMNRFNHSLPDELSAIARALSTTNRLVCSGENDCAARMIIVRRK
jgi:hypothetical protein